MSDYTFPNLIFHPHKTRNQVKNYSGIYNQLLEYNDETPDLHDLRPDLAASYEVKEDGLTWVFRLNDKAMWHDGTPVTAADVVYSLDSIVDPDADRPVTRASIDTYYKRFTAQALDDLTVEVPTAFSALDFLPLLALDIMKIIKEDYVESIGEEAFDEWENAMGSGPFKPGAIKKDISIKLLRNEGYWKEGLPYADGMEHFTMLDKGTLIAAFEAQQVVTHTWTASNLDTDQVFHLVEKNPDILRALVAPNMGFYAVMMNTRVKPYDDPRVRRAINLVIHRPTIVEAMGGGIALEGPPMGSNTWFGRPYEEVIAEVPGYRLTETGEKDPRDIAEAQRLMKEAGFENGFEDDMLIATVVAFPENATFVIQDLKKHLNITLNMDMSEPAARLQRYDAGDYSIAQQGTAHMIVAPDPILKKIYMPGGIYERWTGWVAPQWFQDAYYEQSQELDTEKRKALLRKMEDYLINEDPGPYALQYWTSGKYLVNKKLKNFNMTPTLWAQMKYENVWCDPTCGG